MYLVAKRGITEMGCVSVHICIVLWRASLLNVFLKSVKKPEKRFLSYQLNVAVLFAILFLFCFLRSHSLLLISLSLSKIASLLSIYFKAPPLPNIYIKSFVVQGMLHLSISIYIYIYVYVYVYIYIHALFMFLEGSSGLLLVGGCFFLVSFSSYFACLMPLTPHKLYILYFINHEVRGHFFPCYFPLCMCLRRPPYLR